MIWLAQARQRPGQLHYWIGLELIMPAAEGLAKRAAAKPDEDEEQHAEIEKLERQGLGVDAGMLAVFPVAGAMFGGGLARHGRATCLRRRMVK